MANFRTCHISGGHWVISAGIDPSGGCMGTLTISRLIDSQIVHLGTRAILAHCRCGGCMSLARSLRHWGYDYANWRLRVKSHIPAKYCRWLCAFAHCANGGVAGSSIHLTRSYRSWRLHRRRSARRCRRM